MPPRDYYPDRPATNAERQRRFKQRHRAEPCSLERIDDAPLIRQQKLAHAALQQPPGRPERHPEQFDAWGQRLAEQTFREAAYAPPTDTWANDYAPPTAPDTWITYEADQRASRWVRTDATTKEVLFKSGWRRVPVARAASPVRHIAITPELEARALEDLARIQARGRRKRR